MPVNLSDPADAAHKSAPHRMLFRGRLFALGIGFWILLWIFSILAEVGLKVNLKDRPGMMFVVGFGSLGVTLSHQDISQVNDIKWHEPSFIWSKRNLRLHSKHPELQLARLGGVIWKTSGNRHLMAFPVSGFLWLWLIGGWVARVRKKQRPDFRSKRIMAQAAALILLPLVVLHASRTMTKVLAESEVSGCMMNMRNIQCAARSYWGMKALNSGTHIPWNEIFGPRKIIPLSCRTCPSGQDYILDDRIPDEYRLVVKCPNPGHQRRLKEIDTSGW